MPSPSFARRMLTLVEDCEAELQKLTPDAPSTMANQILNMRLALSHMRTACDARLRDSVNERARRSTDASGTVTAPRKPRD